MSPANKAKQCKGNVNGVPRVFIVKAKKPFPEI